MKIDNEQDKLKRDYWGTCDVKGCNGINCNGGMCWSDTGYWRVCTIHSQMHREGKPQPQMKAKAIKREKSRLPDGTLPVVTHKTKKV